MTGEEERGIPRGDTIGRCPDRRLWDGTWPLHPFLLAAASVITLMARNLNHTGFDDVLPSLLGALLIAAALYLIVVLIRRRFDATAAVIASIWVAGVVYYPGLFGDINRWVQGGFPMVRSLPIALLLLAAFTILALRLRSLAPLANGTLNGIAVAFLLIPLWQVGQFEWNNRGALASYDPDKAVAELQPYLAQAASPDQPPDIYHFIFDRYTSEEVLAQDFDTDNSEIGHFLEDHGFYLARGSNSNYQKTGHSVASTFHMDYLDQLADDPHVKDANWRPIYKMLDDHRAGRFLKSRGYRFAQFGSWWVGTYNSPLADENRPHGFSEFGMLYWRMTMLRPLFHIMPDTPLTMRLDWDNAQCQRVGPQVEEIKRIGENSTEPLYVFAHILVPHGPENFTTDGGCLSQQEAAKRGEAQGYLDQIEYANQIMREIVATLQAPGRRPAVIIFQADEGPFPRRDGRIPWQNASADDPRIKTGILNAYYFPGKDYSGLWQDITPVNTYRILFNTYFGTRLPLLEDHIYAFPNDGKIYEFHDVTNKVRGPGPVAGTSTPGTMPSAIRDPMPN